MATIANLAVALLAKTGHFEAGFKKSRRTVLSFGGAVEGMASKLGGIGAALAGIAGVAGIGVMIKNSAEAIDATGKLANELGMATERLGGYRHAAGLADVDNEKLTGGLRRFVRTVGLAKQGSKSAVEAFDAIGISAKDLATNSPENLFEEVSERLKAIEDPALRAAAVYDIFGKSGQEMTNFLMLGKEGMASAQREAEKLGITVSGMDAAGVNIMNDSLTKVGESLTGIVNKLVIELGPYITWVADAFVNWVTESDGAVQTLVGSLGTIFSGIARVLNLTQILRAAWNLLGTVGAAIGFTIAKGWSVAISVVAKFVDTITFGLMDIQGKTAEAVRFLDGMAEEYDKEMVRNYAGFEDAMGAAFGDRVSDMLAEFDKRKIEENQVAKKAGGMLPDIDEDGGRGKKKDAQFKSINLRRFALEGPGGLAGTATKKQEVTDREGNAILKQILSKIGTGGSVVPVYAGG